MRKWPLAVFDAAGQVRSLAGCFDQWWKMKRVTETVSLKVAAFRLKAWGKKRDRLGRRYDEDLQKASTLAAVIWPEAVFGNAQGAGRAAASVLIKLGCQWKTRRCGKVWGYDLKTIKVKPCHHSTRR